MTRSRSFRKLLASVLALTIALPSPAFAVWWEKVWVTGIKGTTSNMEFDILIEDLLAQYADLYFVNLNGDILLDDINVPSNPLDTRCNLSSKSITGTTNTQSTAADKAARAAALLARLKLPSYQGGLPVGGMQELWDKMGHGNVTVGGTTYTNTRTMTVFWVDGSSTVFTVTGTNGASAAVGVVVRDNAKVTYDPNNNVTIDPTICPGNN